MSFFGYCKQVEVFCGRAPLLLGVHEIAKLTQCKTYWFFHHTLPTSCSTIDVQDAFGRRPRHNLSFGWRAFRVFSQPRICNTLPPSVRDWMSLSCFQT